MSALMNFFSDDDGNQSLMRIAVFLVVAVVLGNWTYLNIKAGAFQKIPWEDVATIIGALFAKAYQKKAEVEKAVDLARANLIMSEGVPK